MSKKFTGNIEPFFQHEGKVIETDSFKHIMALTLDAKSGNKKGLLRCITKRIGDVHVHGYIDRSELYQVEGKTLDSFIITKPLILQNQDEIIEQLTEGKFDFLGLEDPDIWIDPKTEIMHVYFTLPVTNHEKHETYTYLGHAEGQNLDSLIMTKPVLSNDQVTRAKEVSIAPLNKNGNRLNLFESRERIEGVSYSTIQVAEVSNPSDNWVVKKTVFHPKTQGFSWVAGHSSPGPLLPKQFIDVGEDKVLGILNGREANKILDGRNIYGMFSIGLMIYNYETGEIEWVSDKPLIQDTEAKSITFASQFVQTKNNEGILYAHVDDSFVRAYTLRSEDLKKLVPNLYELKRRV